MSKLYIAVKEFADKNNFAKHYMPGEELPDTFGEERLANIVRLGLAKVEGEDELPEGEDELPEGEDELPEGEDESPEGGDESLSDIDLSEKVTALLPKIKVFEDVEKLKEYLEKEKATGEPRKMVVKTIEDRLAALSKGNNE
jgi:hypothetical protein